MQIRRTLVLFILVASLAGCATWESSGLTYQQKQYNLLRQEVDIRKVDYQKRLSEIEQTYKDGKLTEGEYLTLKNNLKQEWHDYSSQVDQRISSITQNAISLNHSY